MRTLILLSAFLFLSGQAAPKVDAPEIKFLSASAASTSPLEGLFTGLPTHFQSSQRNFKLSVVFDRPLDIKTVSLQSCAKEWTGGIQIFTSPGLGRVFVEGGKSKFEVKTNSREKIQSLALVFNRDADLCLQNLKFLDEKDQPIPVGTTEGVKTKSANAKSAPLFDDHPETPFTLEDPVTLNFEAPQTFDRAYIWTGGGPLYAHTLKLKGDKGWSENLPLRNAAADQEVIFKKPFKGRKMSILSPDAGEVAEVRFALGTKVQTVELGFGQQSEVEKKFEAAALLRTLDFEWVTASTEADKWILIFRQDGTFFVRGFSDEQHQARGYSALGAFTIVRQEKNKLRMRLNGVRFPAGLAWDGVSCPFACGAEGAVEGATLITDTLVLEKLDDGTMIVRNRTLRSARTITIGDLKVHRAVED